MSQLSATTCRDVFGRRLTLGQRSSFLAIGQLVGIIICVLLGLKIVPGKRPSRRLIITQLYLVLYIPMLLYITAKFRITYGLIEIKWEDIQFSKVYNGTAYALLHVINRPTTFTRCKTCEKVSWQSRQNIDNLPRKSAQSIKGTCHAVIGKDNVIHPWGPKYELRNTVDDVRHEVIF